MWYFQNPENSFGLKKIVIEKKVKNSRIKRASECWIDIGMRIMLEMNKPKATYRWLNLRTLFTLAEISSDLTPLFGDLSQSKKNPEINSLLICLSSFGDVIDRKWTYRLLYWGRCLGYKPPFTGMHYTFRFLKDWSNQLIVWKMRIIIILWLVKCNQKEILIEYCIFTENM